jgi:thiol:disulfide interchange protein DsbD
MRSIYLAFLLFFAGLCFGSSIHAAGTDEYLDVDEAFQLSAGINNAASARLSWKISDGYSLYKHKFKFTSLTPGIETSAPAFPQGIPKQDKTFGAVEIYRNELQLNLPLIRHQQKLNRFRLSVTYQGCADEGLCYMPETKELTLDFPETNIIGASQSFDFIDQESLISEQDKIAALINHQSLPFILLSFLGFGLLLAFTPCVFPMIPIISGIIIGQGSTITSARAFWLSLSYVLASAFTYMVFGIIAGLFGSNLQAFFQEPAVIAGFSALFIILALSMFGVFTLQMPAVIQTRISILSAKQKSGNWLGAAIMGILSTLAVGPCVTAPLAGALIYIGKTGDAVLGGLALFALGLGMGIPLLLIGTSAGKLLPKSGIWLDITKAVFGIGLLAVAIWLLGRILPAAITLQLWSLLLVVPALYFGWKKLWKTFGGIALIYGVFLLAGVFTQKERDYMGVLCNTAVACEAPSSIDFHKIKTAQELKHTLDKAHNEARWVMFDLYADWCSTCQEMKHSTFSNAHVKTALSDFILVQADVTSNDQKDQELLKLLELIGPPTVLFFAPDKQESQSYRVIGYMDSQNFLKKIAQLKSTG